VSLTVRAEDLRSSFGSHLRDAEVGPLAGEPLLVVELDDGPDVAELVNSLPCVVVAVDRGAHPDDRPPPGDIALTARPTPRWPWIGNAEGWLPRVEDACAANPLAAVTMAQLLRFSPDLSVADGLVAESVAYSMLQAGPEHRGWLAHRPPVARPEDKGPPVLVERRGSWLAVTLNRPERHNAYSAAMRDALVAALQIAHADRSLERIELLGAGRSFCSGGDLSEFGTAPDPATAHAVRVATGAAVWMHRVSDRAVARVHGACIGAGIELAAFAGRVVSAPDTRFCLPEVSMGLVPGAGGTVSVPRRIGPQRAALLAITGHALDAGTARDWGLVDEVTPAADGASAGAGGR
jgi:enoyl-CoA hydratase/carnithine racemase